MKCSRYKISEKEISLELTARLSVLVFLLSHPVPRSFYLGTLLVFRLIQYVLVTIPKTILGHRTVFFHFHRQIRVFDVFHPKVNSDVEEILDRVEYEEV